MAYINPRDAFDVTGIGLGGLQQNAGQAANFAQMLFDPQSAFYQQYRKFLASATPTQGTSTLLAGLMAGGGNYGASQAQAGASQKNFQRQRNDFLNTALNQFGANAIGTGANLLGLAGQNYGQIGQIGAGLRNADINQSQVDAQSGGIFDFLAAPLGFITSNFLSGLIGGGEGAGAAGAAAAISDIRLKENIKYTGGKTKDGIPIATFNFKGNPQKMRGVIAQDVEKIRPDLVVETNGFLAVKYGDL